MQVCLASSLQRNDMITTARPAHILTRANVVLENWLREIAVSLEGRINLGRGYTEVRSMLSDEMQAFSDEQNFICKIC